MKRCLTLMLIALITLGCATAALAAWPVNFEGKPDLLKNGSVDAYFIWHDPDGVHIRVTSKDGPHVFTGSIVTDGKLENIMVKTTDEDDYSRLANDGRLNFRLTTGNNPAGVDFIIIRGEKVRFDLKIDGHAISPAQIFVGTESWNPGDSKFAIRYNEKRDRWEDDSHTTVILGLDWFGWLFGPPGPHHGPPPHEPGRP